MTERAATDEALIRRYLAGDTDAFDELMRAHEDRVFAVCLRMLRDREAALDATQETFVTVFRKADRFAGRSAFSTWLYRVAVNTCYDALRRSGRRRTEPLPDYTDPADPSSDDAYAAAELRAPIEEALAELPAEFRAAVVLSDLEGLPLQTVAELLGVPVGTVKSRVFSAVAANWRMLSGTFRGVRDIKGNREIMNEHELNLIAEHAAGALPADQVEAIEAKIASNPIARAEYDAQIAALAALAATPPAQLNDLERARMRRAVADELHIVREEAEAAPERRRRTVPWARLGTVAAVLAAVVIAAPLLSTLSINSGGDADDELSDPVTAEAPVASTPADRLENLNTEDLGQSDAFASSSPAATVGKDAAQGAEPPEAGADEPLPVADFGEMTKEELTDLHASLTAGLVDGLAFSPLLDDPEAIARVEREYGVELADSCLLQGEETVPGYETAAFVGFASINGDRSLLFLVRPAADGDDLLVAYDEVTCDVLGVFGQ